MTDRVLDRRKTSSASGGRRSVLVSWYGLMSLVGFGFGALSDRRPFGQDILVHPLLMFFIMVALGLLALRVLMARPVPEVISDRALIAGCVLGLAMFLAGNLFSAQIMPLS